MFKLNERKGSVGSVIIIIIIAAIIIAGFYYWGKGASTKPADSSAAAVAGESDEPSNIQSGLNDIDVSVEEDVKAMGEASKGR